MEQQQGDLPLESFLEALKEDVKALGGSTTVGGYFVSAEKDESAKRNYVNDRLNGARRERFSDEQVELIMRRAVARRGFSAAHNYLSDAIGVERSKPKDPELERQRAMTRFTDAAEGLERSLEELRRLNIPFPRRVA